MYGFPAHKLGYQNSSPLEELYLGLTAFGANHYVTYLNANQFQFAAGAPSYTLGGPPNASPLQVGLKKGDQITLTGTVGAGTGPDEGKTFTFTDPDTLSVLETVSSTVEEYRFLVFRRVHNGVLTDTGRQWLTRLCAWASIGDPDVANTGDRVRWIGYGSGGFPMIPNVLTLDSPIEIQTGVYLAEAAVNPTPPSPGMAMYFHFAGTGDLSISGPVLISEAGLFVDQNPPLSLNPADTDSPPVVYKSFDGLMKSSDFQLFTFWTLRF